MLSDARYEAALPCSNLDRAKSFYADKLGLTPADSARLDGATAIHLEADVVLSDVGNPQEISAPGGSFRPIEDLFLTLEDLAG